MNTNHVGVVQLADPDSTELEHVNAVRKIKGFRLREFPINSGTLFVLLYARAHILVLITRMCTCSTLRASKQAHLI